MSTPYEAEIINKERARMASAMTEVLQKLGVQVSIAHYTGDSSFPTEYTISYQNIVETGPTFDMALMSWLGKLIAVSERPLSAYYTMESALRSLAQAISAMRTDVLDIKSSVIKDEPKQSKEECIIWGTSTSMQGTNVERKTYLMTLKDGEKNIPFNLQVHADGYIVAEPRPIHETNYDDLDADQDDDEYDDTGDYDERAYLAGEDDEEG